MKRKKQSVRSVDVNSEKVELKLDWCSHEAAKYACEHWHYSKTIPANKSNYIGVWENKTFIGAIIFGLGASPSLGTKYGLGIFEVCELTRVALNKHITPVTKLISIALKFVKLQNPKTRLVVSFADTFHGHHGGIYQGGNWIYTGETSPSEMLKLANGDLVDPRRYNGHGHNAKKPIPAGTVTIKTPGKHRYLMPLDKEIAKQIESLRKPYPKKTRGGSVTVAQPAIQQERGGSIPTSSHNTGGE
jgi:hypothetical protein